MMTRATRLGVVTALASGLLVRPPFLTRVFHARGEPIGPTIQPPDQAATRLRQYGIVTLRDLPRGGSQTRSRRLKPFRPVHPELFNRRKALTDLAESSLATPSGGPLAPSTIVITDGGFDGISFLDAGNIPPDTQVAVGPDHIFEVVNDYVRVWSRSTSPPSDVYDVNLGLFFGAIFSDIVSDPRVLFDPASGRWFVSCVTLETLFNMGDWRLAVSQTGDPTGSYKLYAGTFIGNFPDFPSLGLSDDKLVLTGNAYTIPAQQFMGSEFLVANKADLLAGVSAPSDTFFGPPQAVDSIQAAMSLSSTSRLFMAAVTADGQTSTLQLWSVDGVPGVGSGVSVATQALALGTTLVIPPNAAQPNSAITIATNDTRLLNLVYRGGWLWMGSTTGCTPAGDTAVRACLNFIQIDTMSLTVSQEIVFGQTGIYHYYPAVAVEANNSLLTVFNRSSASEFASVYASGHNVSDPVGTLRSPTLVHAGLAVYDPSPFPPRWGDYSGTAVDPVDHGQNVWIAGEYTRADGGIDWGSWIAKIASPAPSDDTGPSTPAAPPEHHE